MIIKCRIIFYFDGKNILDKVKLRLQEVFVPNNTVHDIQHPTVDGIWSSAACYTFFLGNFSNLFLHKRKPSVNVIYYFNFQSECAKQMLNAKVTNSVVTASTLKMSFKITVSRDFWPFFCLKDSTWAPYEQAKTVSRTYSFFAKIFAKKRMSA